MKSSIVVSALLASVASAKIVDVNLRFLTYNIRWATPSPGAGEPAWVERRPKMSAQLNFETASRPEALICLQEVVHQQVTDIHSDLGDSWARIGVGRDDGAEAGEYSPIFYRPGTWELQKNRTYWLSETPDKVSTGWDAALPRIATVAQFKHIKTGAPVVYMCTHFDHVGQVARENSAKLLVEIADEWEEPAEGSANPTPVFLGGDLNIQPDNAAYLTLIAEGAMHDTKDIVPSKLWHGNTNTFTGFTTSNSDDSRIDHMFVRDPLDIEFLSYGVLANSFDDGVFISDHRPVVVDAQLSVNKTCVSR